MNGFIAWNHLKSLTSSLERNEDDGKSLDCYDEVVCFIFYIFVVFIYLQIYIPEVSLIMILYCSTKVTGLFYYFIRFKLFK